MKSAFQKVPTRSCLTNLLLTEEWLTLISDEGDVDMMFLDFSKAFDSVNHRFLLNKLVAYGIDAGLIRGIQAFLRGRSFRVAVNGCVSESRSAQRGVPQGSVLGPILFLIYVNDLLDLLQEKVRLFDDYVKLISQRSYLPTLQNDLMKAFEWSKNWNLTYLIIGTAFTWERLRRHPWLQPRSKLPLPKLDGPVPRLSQSSSSPGSTVCGRRCPVR